MSNSAAVQSADYALEKIIKEQPNFLAAKTFTAEEGKDLGEFIAALRNRLIAMYTEEPRQ